MDPEDLLEAIDDLSPQAQYVLLISSANHLREAVDEGRISSVVLTQAAGHLRMLVDGGLVAQMQQLSGGAATMASTDQALKPAINGH